MVRQPGGVRRAVRTSAITTLAFLSPFCQPARRASRHSTASGCAPAATRIVRAHRRKSGQRDATTINASGGIRKPPGQRARHGTDMQCYALGTGGQARPRRLELAQQHDGNGSDQRVGTPAIVWHDRDRGKPYRRLDLRHQDVLERLIGFITMK